MDILTLSKWKEYYNDHPHRSGLHLRFEKGVDPEVKRSIQECVAWMRHKYVFPKRIRLYIKSARRIKAKNGEWVCGTFFRPADRNVEPHIRLATGDYLELLIELGKDDALASILHALFHELTHYFQWLNDLDLTLIGEERQATVYANKLLREYAQTREHP